jgi:predicted kinase
MELIMLCGIPTAGKSTFSKNKKYKNYVRISSDDILDEIAKQRETTYNAIFAKNIGFAQKLMMKNLRSAIEQGKNIIWDQTNITPKQRIEKLKMVPSDYYKVAVWFMIPMKDALTRNLQRHGKIIPPEVIQKMYHDFEIPTLYEGFNEIIRGN